jgi:hypothetical protein
VSRTAIRFELGDDVGRVEANGSGGLGQSSGGGSGGGVLLEAPIVEFMTGTGISANGGGGGGGCLPPSGDPGAFAETTASGKDCGGVATAGSGGHGGALEDGTPDDGEAADIAGGGGGGVGRIRINTADGTLSVPSGVILSPAPSVGVLARQ